MKTFRELFEELDEPYRSQAIENAENNEIDIDEAMTYNVRNALNAGFVWANTDQGHEYWSELDAKLICKLLN